MKPVYKAVGYATMAFALAGCPRTGDLVQEPVEDASLRVSYAPKPSLSIVSPAYAAPSGNFRVYYQGNPKNPAKVVMDPVNDSWDFNSKGWAEAGGNLAALVILAALEGKFVETMKARDVTLGYAIKNPDPDMPNDGDTTHRVSYEMEKGKRGTFELREENFRAPSGGGSDGGGGGGGEGGGGGGGGSGGD